MRLGAHMSISGGPYTAYARGAAATCDSMLIFTKSNRQWASKPLLDEDIELWRNAAANHSHITPVAVHASYLINIASPKPDLWEKSYQALKDEVQRAEALGIPFLTFHPGSHMDSGIDAGLQAISQGLMRLVQETEGYNVIICLETMAGQGTNLGYKFEQLATVLDGCGRTPRLGVCMDTCHIFAAGYDIRTPETYAQTMAEFDRIVGLEWIKCFHFNDSIHGLGENKDRHAHIGQGQIGLEGFASFVNDPRWAEHGAHLETDKTETGPDGQEIDMDIANLATLRSLIK
ncbi:MAG: deoxyribonuclease IV [Chloroflexi bacterium]|nr:deoxyribonuclease IV [Chloroflexota bacterium]MBP8058156.1 deoxyribonuclease IV [Chloroflexota bacterium]